MLKVPISLGRGSTIAKRNLSPTSVSYPVKVKDTGLPAKPPIVPFRGCGEEFCGKIDVVSSKFDPEPCLSASNRKIKRSKVKDVKRKR